MNIGLYLGANYKYQNKYDVSDYTIIRSNFFPEEPSSLKFPSEIFIDAEVSCENLSFAEKEKFSKILYHDGNVQRLWERLARRVKFKYLNLDRMIKIRNLAENILDNIYKYDFECVVFSYSPHNIISYITQKALDFLNIPYFIIDTCMFHWRLKAYDQDKKPLINPACDYELHTQSVNGLFSYIQKKNDVFYMPKRVRPKILQTPLNLYRSWMYFLLFKDKVKNEKQTLTVYLNYQPESTTFPVLSDGAFIFNFLSTILNCCETSNFHIQIKEHPAQFRQFEADWRSSYFMKQLRQKGCGLIEAAANNNSILRGSGLVASLNGTVLVERLLLGLPIVYSQHSSISDYHGAGVIRLGEAMHSDFDTLASANTIKNDFKDFLIEQGKFTFGPDLHSFAESYNLEKWRSDRYDAINEILKTI